MPPPLTGRRPPSRGGAHRDGLAPTLLAGTPPLRSARPASPARPSRRRASGLTLSAHPVGARPGLRGWPGRGGKHALSRDAAAVCVAARLLSAEASRGGSEADCEIGKSTRLNSSHVATSY